MLRIAFLSRTPLPFPAVHATATLLTLLSLTAPAAAGPVDPVVRNGVATFAVNGNVFTVTNTPGAIIDWRQFNVANGELLRFLQQNAQSTVLNRVTGNDPSQILGALQSNGRVLLVNPNGVLFGANATVDVAGLVVSGLRLSDADFLAGKYNFAGGNGAVSNLGSITTPLGGSVYLIGGDVANSGVIRAPGGQILLAAGQSVSLADSGAPNLSVTLSANGNQARNLGELNASGGRIDIYGALVDQQGIVRADSSGVDAQGRIVLKASDQATLSGTLSAASADGVGGTVQVLGDKVTLSEAARIDASGALGGGTVLVGGDYQGKNAAVQNASTTTVAAGASINASARERGDGGKVVVWSDGVTAYNGVVLARGGAQGGDGGLVETSGHTLRNGGKVDTRAPKGRTGNWLLDPGVYCFYSVSASECAGGADSTVDDINNIEDYLATSNATLQATNYISFLPAGGSATVDPAIPSGYTLKVLAPYIEVGRGAVIDTSLVGLSLAASPFYGTTTRTDSNGANLTGSIVIRGLLTSNASQTLSADSGIRVLAQSGQYKAGLDMRAAGGMQTLLTTGLLDVAVEGTQAGSDITATISSAGAQIIAADRITVRGGNGSSGSSNMAVISSQANQSVSGADIALTGGSAGAARVVVNGDGATQLIESETLELTAGSGGRVNGARLAIDGVNTKQTIHANQSITMTGGTGGSGNGANLYAWGGGDDGKNTVQDITTGVLTVKGGATAGPSADDGNFATLVSYGTQKITAASIAVQGGSSQQLVNDGVVSSAQISAPDQVITVSGALSVTGGTGAGHSIASINSEGAQTITAGSVTVAAGNAGVANSADITSVQSQNLIVGGALAVRGGAAGNDNNAWIGLTGTTGGKQSVSSASLTLKAGDGGVFNRASLSASGVNAVQEVSATQSMDITAGAGGEGNYAQIRVDGGTSQASATQKVTGGAITIKGGVSSSTDDTRGNNASLDSAGAQTVAASSIALQAGSNTVAVANYGASHAFIGSGSGGQTINVSGDITLTGGAGVGNAHTNIYTYGSQTITANTISAHAGNTGTNNSIDISIYRDTNLAPVPNLVQSITANNLLLQAGDAGTSNSARLGINGAGTRQNINVGNLSLTGGAGGNDNRVSVSLYDDTAKSTNVQTVTAAAISISGGKGQDNNAAIDSQGMQTIIADGVALQSGSGGNSTASIYAAVDQAIAVKNMLALTGGSATSGAYNSASLNANGNQTISAAALLLTAGASGSNNGANINGDGNQTIAVQKLLVQGGSGGSSNSANITMDNGAGHTQRITASESMTLQAGAGGSDNIAGTHANGAGVAQVITTPNLTVAGGAGGTGNWAHMWAYDDATVPVAPAQSITAGTVKVLGGGGVNSDATIGGNGNQSIKADVLTVAAGSGSAARASISTSKDQAIAVTGAMTLTGGAVAINGGDATDDQVNVRGYTQTINAGSLALTGGASGNQNYVDMYADASQTINVQGTLSISGGADGTRNSAGIQTSGNQAINAKNLVINGGVGGSENAAYLYEGGNVARDFQTINAGNITMKGGAGQSNYSDLFASGKQTITVIDTLSLAGGAGSDSGAYLSHVRTNDQTVNANRLLLSAGSASNSGATLTNTFGTQTINLTGARSELALIGGGNAGVTDANALVGQLGTGEQKITINGGGAVRLVAGNGDGLRDGFAEDTYCPSCKVSNNAATIFNLGGGNQTLDFVAGGTLDLIGGNKGAGNSAVILADLSKGAQQTVTSSGGAANYAVITLTGGSGGYYNQADGATQANNAAIASSSQTAAGPASSLKTINAKSITLNGGGTATTHGGALLGTGQGDAVINVTGDLVMTGGASSVPLLAATTPATAFSRDQGAIAAINPDGNLKLAVGGNLLMQGGSGTSSGALIDANSAAGKVTLAVAGATRMLAGASSAAILSHTTTASADPTGGAVVVDLGSDGAFTTSTFASSGKSFRLSGKLTADGANANAPLLSVYSPTSDAPDWKVLGAKDLQAGIYASDSYVNQGEIVTPNGNWLVALGKNAAAAADPASVINYDLLTAHGYQWTPTAYDSANAAEFRFILPGDAPVVDLRAADNIANATCVTNAAMCATPGASNGAAAGAVPAAVTYDVQLNVADSTPPAAPSTAKPAASEDGPAGGVATAQVGVGGKRAATREKEEAQAADDKKTTAELKREARVASSEAKADMAAVRKVELAARKDAGAARAAAVAAAKEEAQAKRAEATAQRADADLKLVAGDVAKAEAEVRGAATPVLKVAAQARKADVDARRAGLEAKLADANAKKAEAGARRSEAQAKGADAKALGTDAGARALAAEAKLAEAARSEALVQAREAKSPQQRAAAERLAEDKRADATQKNAESRVQLALAEDLRLAASQGKVQADARRAQAQAGALEAQARREESQVQAATARSHQEEAAAQRAVAGGKPEVAKAAQARKAGLDRQVAVQARKAEDRKVAAAAKAEEAKAKQAKADEAALVVAQRDDARRQRALKAFAATATAAMSGDQLAERAALRHAYKTEVFKEALTILAQNSHAADLPVCAGGAVNVCVPAPVQLQAQLRAQVTQGARPPLRLPSAAFLPQIERKVALVIGINNYQDKRITPLDSAVPDADAVAALMAERMGYEVRVLRDATKADIVNGIAALSRELGPKDSVTVYYAGHGYMTNNSKNGQQGYWIPSDASSNNPANWISTGDVGRLLAAIPASQVMLVSDSCYSGTFAKEQQVAAGADASQILARRSVVVMSSGGEEPVADDGVDGHSIFAWSLMQAMRQVDRYDTGARVFDATKSKVTAAYPQVPRYGAAVSAGHASGGDYLFEARSYK